MVNVIPAPASVTYTTGAPFVLSDDTPVVATPDLQPLASTFITMLEASTGVVLSLGDSGNKPAITLRLTEHDDRLASLPVPRGRRADDGDPADEAYALDVDANGITLTAHAPEGVFRGLMTVLQVIATTPVASEGIDIAPVSIVDAPRFAWRGLSFDVVRRAYSVAEVKGVIDLLALYKANVLHLHLTDAEGWRIEVDAWPKLASIASTTAVGDRPGGYFTKDQYRHLVHYAADRFITVVPEIEMPGHAAAIFRAYPELAGDGVNPETTNLNRSPWFQTMHPDNPGIFTFLEDIFREVAEMTPGAYLHIGGDEALGMDPNLYSRFMARARELAYETGKNIVAWQETSRSGFAPEDIAQIWLEPSVHDLEEDEQVETPEDDEPSPEMAEIGAAFAEANRVAPYDLDRILEQGPAILMSLQPVAYFDTRHREPSANPDQADEQARVGAPFYRPRTLQDFFMWDPGTIKPNVDESRIAGVEAAIWCESVESDADLFFLIIPRLPGLLEKAWSPPAESLDSAWDDYATRLAAHDGLWEHRNWNYFRSSAVWADPR